jgi:hypothetical protein
MSKKMDALIFSKDGKDIKWGIEISDGWKVKKVTHKGKQIAELCFGSVMKDSLESGYSFRKAEINEEDKDKYWEEFSALTPEEQLEKEAWEKEVAAIKEKKQSEERLEEEFRDWRIERLRQEEEKLFEEFLKTKEK